MRYPLVLDLAAEGDPRGGDLLGARFLQAGFGVTLGAHKADLLPGP
jgi:hypothetical protein